MLGFQGPFEFAIDEEGSVVNWDRVDEHIRTDLTKDGQFTEENSTIYFSKIAVRSTEHVREKHHDWAKVNRLCIQADTPPKGISICGIYPRDKRMRTLSQAELAFVPSLGGEAKLFNTLEFKFNLSNPAKLLSRADRFAVLSTYSKHFAQWVYSPGWDGIDFELYLYAIVLKSLPPEEKYYQITIKPLRKGNKVLTKAGVWRQPIRLP